MKGCDYAWGRPGVQALQDAGVTFVCRYLGYDTTGKNIDAAEASALHAAGIAVVLNFEYSPTGALLGRTQGVADAAISKAQRAALGAPDSVPVYFSVDWNATVAEISGPVADYFQGVATVLPVAQIGVYGGYLTIQTLMMAGLVTYGWQTYAWSGGAWAHPHIRQTQNGVTIGGVGCDIDESIVDNYGQWLPDNAIGVAMDNGFGFVDADSAEIVRWRIAALVDGSDTVQGGPMKGEPVWLNQHIKAIEAKLDAAPAATGGVPASYSGSVSGSLSGTVTLTPNVPTVPSGQ